MTQRHHGGQVVDGVEASVAVAQVALEAGLEAVDLAVADQAVAGDYSRDVLK